LLTVTHMLIVPGQQGWGGCAFWPPQYFIMFC